MYTTNVKLRFSNNIFKVWSEASVFLCILLNLFFSSCLFSVWRFSERQQQRRPEVAGWSQIHFSVSVGTQREAGQSRHLLAHRPDRSHLLDSKLPHHGAQLNLSIPNELRLLKLHIVFLDRNIILSSMAGVSKLRPRGPNAARRPFWIGPQLIQKV